MITIKRSLLTMFLLAFATVIQPAFCDYLTFQADPQRTGNVSCTGPDSPNILWRETITNHAFYGGATVYEDRIYVCDALDMSFSGQQALACLNANEGSILWTNFLGGKGSFSTPALADDLIFVGSFTGDLYCINAATGETIWNVPLVTDASWFGLASSPLVVDDQVFVTSFTDGTLHVFDFEGHELWNISTPGEVNELASPAYWDGNVYFVGGDPALYCVDVSSQSVLWTYSTNSEITTTPTIWNGSVFFASADELLSMDAKNGEELWTVPINVKLSSPAISFGRLYLGTFDNSFDCYDALDGSLLWSTDVNGPIKTPPVVAGDLIYFGTNTAEGQFYALNTTDGSVVWTYPVNEFIMSSPTVSDGVLYFGAEDNHIYAFGPERSKVLWEGEVALPDGSFNLTAISGETYSIEWRSAMGALYKAAEQGQFRLEVSDLLWNFYGLTVESIDDLKAKEGLIWNYAVMGSQTSASITSPDIFQLNDGDLLIFYLDDDQSDPQESPRVVIKVNTN